MPQAEHPDVGYWLSLRLQKVEGYAVRSLDDAGTAEELSIQIAGDSEENQVVCEVPTGADAVSEADRATVAHAIADRIVSTWNRAADQIDRPEVICLCGSSRFVAEMAVIAWTLEKEGKITMGLHLLPESYPTKCDSHLAEAEGVAAQMDELHLRKIDLADRVFVVNVGGYIGDSTQREIEYAQKNGKPIVYLEDMAKVREV